MAEPSSSQQPQQPSTETTSETSTIHACENLWTLITHALNTRDFTAETWYSLLAPAFRLETDDLRRWGFIKGWTREQMKKGVEEAATKFPDWEFKVLQMDTSVEAEGQAATVVANTHSTLAGFQRRSVMTLECARLDDGWRARRLVALSGFDMGAMEAGQPSGPGLF